MKPEILLAGPLPPEVTAELHRRFTVHVAGAELDEAQRGRVRGIATRSALGADAALMRRFPALEIISVFGVGCDAVDLPAARAQGIIVTNTPDVLTEDTADYAIALTLALARRLVEGDRHVRAGRWPQGPLPNAVRLRGRCLGIVGLGRIGLVVARRAEAFGMSVAWHGPRPKPDLPYAYHPTIAGLAEAADFLVLTCPGGAQTDGLVGGEVLERLGPGGFLVNIARGSVVDEAALIHALRTRAIAGAALDVFQTEPDVPAAFLGLDNVIVEPHIASATVETRRAIGDLVVRNLADHFDGLDVPSRVI